MHRQDTDPRAVLEGYRRLGWTEAKVLAGDPTLRAADLVHAWAYVDAHRQEIDEEVRQKRLRRPWPRSTREPRRMKRATYEDVLNAPENKVAEILDGELFLSPRPLAPRDPVGSSRDLLGALGSRGLPLTDGVGRTGGSWLLTEPGLHFGEQVVCPTSPAGVHGCPHAGGGLLLLVRHLLCEALAVHGRTIGGPEARSIYAEPRVAHTHELVIPPGAHARSPCGLREGAWTVARGDPRFAKLIDPFVGRPIGNWARRESEGHEVVREALAVSVE